MRWKTSSFPPHFLYAPWRIKCGKKADIQLAFILTAWYIIQQYKIATFFTLPYYVSK